MAACGSFGSRPIRGETAFGNHHRRTRPGNRRQHPGATAGAANAGRPARYSVERRQVDLHAVAAVRSRRKATRPRSIFRPGTSCTAPFKKARRPISSPRWAFSTTPGSIARTGSMAAVSPAATNGYFQAGKYTPSGQILVADDTNVYGFGRKPQYLKWTTTMEHQLFSANKKAAEQALDEGEPDAQRAARRGETNTHMIRFEKKPSLSPANTPLAVMAWVNAEQPSGVIVARGGPAVGYALVARAGQAKMVCAHRDRQSRVRHRSQQHRWRLGASGWRPHQRQETGTVCKRPPGRFGRVVRNSSLPIPPSRWSLAAMMAAPLATIRAPAASWARSMKLRLYHGELTAEEIAALAGPQDAVATSCRKNASLQAVLLVRRRHCQRSIAEQQPRPTRREPRHRGKNRRRHSFSGRRRRSRRPRHVRRESLDEGPPAHGPRHGQSGRRSVHRRPAGPDRRRRDVPKAGGRDPYVHVQLAQQNDAFDGKLGARCKPFRPSTERRSSSFT